MATFRFKLAIENHKDPDMLSHLSETKYRAARPWFEHGEYVSADLEIEIDTDAKTAIVVGGTLRPIR